MPGIFLRRDEGELVLLHGELYASEDQLQELLEANPELLLGETAGSDRPSKYLLVRREAGVPQAGGGSDRWFLDHLFLDAEGVPTLVEVKRSSDSRIRREVVGQMLDYAANILAYWPPERTRDEFKARCSHAGVEPAEKVREISDADYFPRRNAWLSPRDQCPRYRCACEHSCFWECHIRSPTRVGVLPGEVTMRTIGLE